MANARTTPKPKHVAELYVSYGNVNVGDRTARLGVSISRANLTVEEADRLFCERRIVGQILARPNGALAEQPSLPGLEGAGDLILRGSFDCKGFSANGRHIASGLTVMLSTIHVEELARFAKREGVLTIEALENMPADQGNGAPAAAEATEGDDE